MKIKKSIHICSWLIVIFALWLGMQFYVQPGRPETMASKIIDFLMVPTIQLPELPSLLTYSLSDGLWMMALCFFIITIWNFHWTKLSIFYYVLAVLLGLSFEFLQFIPNIPGTFDPGDVAAITIGACIPILFTQLLSYYEKPN